MLELRALHTEVERLRLGAKQLGFGLHHISAAGHAHGVTIARELERFQVGRHGVFKKLLLRVIHAQLEEVRRQFRLQ